MDAEVFASYLVRGLFLGACAPIAFATAWLALAFHRTPPEVLQLRLARQHTKLQRALLALAASTVAGLSAVAPSALGLGLALPWIVGWTCTWGVMSAYGFLVLVRIFHVPKFGASPT